jgi:hypothetical protein
MGISTADQNQYLRDDYYNSLRYLFEGAIAWHAWKHADSSSDVICRHQGVLGMYTAFVEARVLYEFFHNHKSRGNNSDDARADDFTSSSWRANESTVYRDYLAALKPANKRMFHPVYRRSQHSGETATSGPLKEQVLEAAKDLRDVAEEFIKHIIDPVSRGHAQIALERALTEAQKAADHYGLANPLDPAAVSPIKEHETQDGWRIVYDGRVDMLLMAHYMAYNNACFDNSLPDIPLVWAKTIVSPAGQRAHGLYVSEESPDGRRQRFIALDEKLSAMFGLERFCLLHEMVHAKLDPAEGHGPEFIVELKRVLDVTSWEVLIGDSR